MRIRIAENMEDAGGDSFYRLVLAGLVVAAIASLLMFALSLVHRYVAIHEGAVAPTTITSPAAPARLR